jgi:hypothetical protein
MELFKDINKTYKKRETAVKRAEAIIAHRPDSRYVIGSTKDGRYFPIFIGQESFDLVHAGFCVAA